MSTLSEDIKDMVVVAADEADDTEILIRDVLTDDMLNKIIDKVAAFVIPEKNRHESMCTDEAVCTDACFALGYNSAIRVVTDNVKAAKS